MADRQDNEVEEADQVYLLMKEEYRISRNVRLAWFLGKLNQLNSENELDLLSILPKGWQTDFSPSTLPYLLVPSTRVTFLARRYRFIIELDLSPSTGIVVTGLVRRFKVPGTDLLFQSEIFVTILAYSSIIGLNTHQIYQQLRAVENNIAEVLQQQHGHLQRQHDLLQQHGHLQQPDQARERMLITLDCPTLQSSRNRSIISAEIFVTILAYSSIIGLNTHQIYQQLRAVENNIAEVYNKQHGHLQRQHDLLQQHGHLQQPDQARRTHAYYSGTQLEVKLVLLWKHNMRIEYLAVAPWPLDPAKRTTCVEVTMEGSYDILHDISCTLRKPITSPYRTSIIRRFWNTLQRWLHMHRIAIILEHDMPVPKHLHTAGSNGRFSTIQCRISHSALTSLLRDWSSFVLVEGYSYPPNSFYLVRLISKVPCIVLRLGFPIGTLAHTRNKIVDELREQILRLRFPQRIQNKEATPKTKRKILGSPPLPAPKPALSDRPCVVVLNKPLEKLLISYNKLPSDFRTPFILNMENFAQPPSMTATLSMAANRTASSTLASLSRYFLHQRWVWAVQGGLGSTVPLQAVAHILSMLSEIRLSEGFHFAASGDGIVNMVTELPMKGMPEAVDREIHNCIVQYILFQPHSTSTKDSFSTDDDNDTEVEAIDVDTELNLVTECWVEPQSRTVWSTRDQHRHFH
ncbi:unnamed protein product [Coregonus sp. 'balchen']|nr:unnamed protein product [Coregonus sp. 'balchen']